MEENVDKTNAVKPLDEVEQQLQEMFNGVEEKVEVEKQPEDAEKPKKETPIKNQNNNKKISKKKIKRKKENQISKPTPVEVTPIPSLTKFKGPYIQVRQNLVTVVNFPKNDDEVEKLQSKQKYMSHKNEKRKIRGMHASTLSIKYDDQTTDHTWVCIFCKKGPHKDRLGDLYGPYIIDLHEKHPTQKKMKSMNENNSTPDHIEIWTHENCAVMTCGVYICGNKIIGLEEAAERSQTQKCMYCQLPGATIGCLKRNCKNIGHVTCTKQNSWKISQDFQYYCATHVT